MATNEAVLARHFENLAQQREAQTVGMWIFLATELLVFGALFAGYGAYLAVYTEAFEEASRHMNLLIGSINTLVLLTSSLTMALAVHFTKEGNRRWAVTCLVLTTVLGLLFLSLKALEYYLDYQEHLLPGAVFRPDKWTALDVEPHNVQLYLVFYYVMTGTHYLHMTVGIGVLTVLVSLSLRGRFGREHYTPVELGGLYWHFVDVVWLFLFPLLYLISTHHHF